MPPRSASPQRASISNSGFAAGFKGSLRSARRTQSSAGGVAAIDPHSVGVPATRLVLGKHSGRHALAQRVESLGYPMSKEQLDTMYHRFTALADTKKGLRNEEIAELAREVAEGPKSSSAAAD